MWRFLKELGSLLIGSLYFRGVRYDESKGCWVAEIRRPFRSWEEVRGTSRLNWYRSNGQCLDPRIRMALCDAAEARNLWRDAKGSE